jgi:hypothetical protein
MATEHNQNTKSMDSSASNTSNTIANDTDRKYSSQDIKCEISTDKHQNETQINQTTKCNDLIMESWMKRIKPLKSDNCEELRAQIYRLEIEAYYKEVGFLMEPNSKKNDDEW